MKQLAVISGKGGTGKTTLAGAFAFLSPGAVFADCDVDAANLNLIACDPSAPTESEVFLAGVKAQVESGLCDGCGWCEKSCRFSAILMTEREGTRGGKVAAVDRMSCEGCGVCFEGCPTNAISLLENSAGELLVTPSRTGTLVHARLNPGEGSSGKLVTQVRSKAKELARRKGADMIIIDGSPGMGCSVIASLAGVDAALVVTEPTVSGKSDLIRVLELCSHFEVKVFVLINKHDLCSEMAFKIRGECLERGVPVLGDLPFDPAFLKAMKAGKSIVEFENGSTARKVAGLWSALRDSL